MSSGFDNYLTSFKEIDRVFQLKKIPKLKVAFRNASNNITNIMDIFVRKSLLKEDLYNYDDSLETRFFLIESKAFSDEKKPMELYSRLKTLINSLNYQFDKLPDSIDNFEEDYLENCRKILDYLSFQNLNSSNMGVNTRYFKELVEKVYASNDDNLKKIVSDNLKLLSEAFHTIQTITEEITKLIKDLYKAQLRFEVFSELPKSDFKQDFFKENKEAFINKLQNFMITNMPAIEIKSYWITEAITDWFSQNDEEIINRLKSNFLSESEMKQTEKMSFSPREKLLTLIFELTTCRSLLQDIYVDLDYNIKLITVESNSFIDKLVSFFKTAMNITTESDFFHIEYINPINKKIQKDVIKIEDFLQSIKKNINIFSEISKKDSPLNIKVRNGTNESLNKFLDNSYYSILLLKERLVGINTEISIKINKAQKKRMRNPIENVQRLETILNNVGSERRKFVMEQENFSGKSSMI